MAAVKLYTVAVLYARIAGSNSNMTTACENVQIDDDTSSLELDAWHHFGFLKTENERV